MSRRPTAGSADTAADYISDSGRLAQLEPWTPTRAAQLPTRRQHDYRMGNHAGRRAGGRNRHKFLIARTPTGSIKEARAALIMNDKVCFSLSDGGARATRNPVRTVTILLASLALFVGGCGKSPEEQKAAKAAEIAQTTGSLFVKSNRPEATIEATYLSPTGEVTPAKQGLANQPLAGLRPGQHAVVVRSAGWPELAGAVNVTAGQATEVTMNFKIGSLQLDSEPSGATVKHGDVVLGQTPLLLLELPAGECALTLEYRSWPPLAFKTTIVENVESTAMARLPHGKLVVETTPAGATVQLDGKAVGQTPLTLEQLPAGPKKVRLLLKDFPTLLVTTTVEDRAAAKINLELATGFPLLDPTELLRAVWVPDDPNRLSPTFDAVGRYEPKNGIVKNLHRKKLFDDWLGKKYRFTGTVKGYDPRDGEIEFVEQSITLSKYRVVAKLSPEARLAKNPATQPAKGATVTLYGQLTAAEEPRWPSKVITLEISSAETLSGDTPAAP